MTLHVDANRDTFINTTRKLLNVNHKIIFTLSNFCTSFHKTHPKLKFKVPLKSYWALGKRYLKTIEFVLHIKLDLVHFTEAMDGLVPVLLVSNMPSQGPGFHFCQLQVQSLASNP